MSPPVVTDAPMQKIKGGKWTVFKFFLISTAYTSAWMAVSSQLDYFRELHGPQILLQMNIAYYLPTIPLLVVSARFDEILDRKLGIAKTILVRLSIGLAGYGILCAIFPFFSRGIHELLLVVIGLGLFSGLAFSASYQLVSRFANKNVIALGLGCSAAGPLVMLLELGLRSGAHATALQQRQLYGTVTAMVVVGAAASASLLIRHWDALEASKDWAQAAGGSSGGGGGGHSAAEAPTNTPPGVRTLSRPRTVVGWSSDNEADGPNAPLLVSHQLSEDLSTLIGSTSMSTALAVYGSVEPFRTFLTTGDEVHDPDASFYGAGSPLASKLSGRDSWRAGVDPATEAEAGSHVQLASGAPMAAQQQPLAARGSSSRSLCPDGGPAVLTVLAAIKLPIASLFLSSAIALAVFPFFTYVPDSGLVGDAFPRVLFFGRVFADIAGRLAPRSRLLAPRRPSTVFAVVMLKLTLVPIFFVYLRAPPAWRSDVGALGLVFTLWLLGGWVNTSANLFAPRLVPPELKGTAAGLMAIAYQTAHFIGLAVAVVVALGMYGDITPHD